MNVNNRLKNLLWVTGTKLRRPGLTIHESFKHHVFDAIGTEVFEENWDLLIILDACRPDVLRSVQTEYQFLTRIETVFSKGSSSQQWIKKNFHQEHRHQMQNTAYITGNPFSNDYLDEDDFAILDEVWRYCWDDEVGTIPPMPVTEQAISHGREMVDEQMIVHYMQPHFPSIPRPEIGSAVDPLSNTWVDSVWDRLEDGSLTRGAVWDAYQENLRYVLDSVSLLLENIDAETAIITADHGNGFGEAGIFGHPRLRTHRVLREVPWVVTTASDKGTHEPAPKRSREVTDEEVRDRLADLGYT